MIFEVTTLDGVAEQNSVWAAPGHDLQIGLTRPVTKLFDILATLQ